MVEIKKIMTKKIHKLKKITYEPEEYSDYPSFGRSLIKMFELYNDMQKENTRFLLDYRMKTAGIDIYNELVKNFTDINKHIEDIKQILLINENLILKEDFIVQEEIELENNEKEESAKFNDNLFT